jgi:hypothetical protein
VQCAAKSMEAPLDLITLSRFYTVGKPTVPSILNKLNIADLTSYVTGNENREGDAIRNPPVCLCAPNTKYHRREKVRNA